MAGKILLKGRRKSTNFSLERLPEQVNSQELAQQIFAENRDAAFDAMKLKLSGIAEQQKKLVIVYQMGKVGSSSYVNTLKGIDDIEVLHVHRLNTRNNEQMIAFFLKNGMVRLAAKERQWQAVLKFIEHRRQPVYVLSAMRNPIRRNISAFFQNLKLTGGEDIDVLIRRFLKSYAHDTPKKWFDEQFRDALGIDIFDHAFNRSQGWGSFTHACFNCLLITAEMKNVHKLDKLNEWLGCWLDAIKVTNKGDSKDYSELYGNFKQAIKLPRAYIDSQLESRVVSYFYTPEQIDAFRSEWVAG